MSGLRRSFGGSVRRRQLTVAVVSVSLGLLGSPVLSPAAQADDTAGDESTRRVGVLAVAGAISAVGQTPELATPLPFTQTSLADVLALDEQLTAHLDDALTGEDDLAAGLEAVAGIDVVESQTDSDTITFTYSRSVEDHPLPLVHDDGDLRFGANDGAGDLSVSLVTDPAHPFRVQILDEADPLLRVALVSEPELDLSVDIDTPAVAPFGARQGFTEVRVTDGHYAIHRDQRIRMRDPDGRSLLTLEDLRYSTLPDLFRVTTGTDDLDVQLDVALPGSLTGGSGRTGTLTLDGTPQGAVWPTADDATRQYGDALARATGLSMADGLTSLAQYTGTVLALQDAANVDFPNLGGGTSDLFAPGDELLALLSTAAAAQVRCGAAPTNPPTGVAAPGDTVYCDATTADGLGTLGNLTWQLHDAGTITSRPDTALGTTPSGVVQVDGSDGEPDLSVTFTATPSTGSAQQLTARSMPRTVQDVVRRIGGLAGSTASARLTAGRLDVSVGISQGDTSEQLALGNPDELGALVGLTGLAAPEGQPPARGTARASSASFDVGFGIQTGGLDAGEARGTFLLPADGTLLQVDGLSATAPSLGTMTARIGFLGVTATLDSLSLGQQGDGPAVELDRVVTGSTTATDPLLISDLLTGDGALDPDQLDLTSRVTAGIGFTATEQPLTEGGSDFATGAGGPASGTATVDWSPGGLPEVTTDTGYAGLRVFDPVPAAFLSGTAHVAAGDPDGPDDDLSTADDNGAPDTVTVHLPGTDLYDVLNASTPADDPGAGDVEVARRMLAEGLACQNVTIRDAHTLTCDGLAPNGVAGWRDGQSVELIVLGDPFAMRDSVIEGLSAALSGFDRITDDGIGDFPDDQYTSTLPLADLTPAQLAVERESLRRGLAAISDAATDDELGGAAHPVSSAQELKRSVPQLVQLGSTAGADGLTYTLGPDNLGIALTASTPGAEKVKAKLRFTDADRGQVSSAELYDVGVDSTTTLAIDVDRDTSRPAVSDATGTSSTATLDLGPSQLGQDDVQAGVTGFTVRGVPGTAAGLGVTVDTDYVVAGDGTGEFETTRSKAGRAGQKAATADLVVGEDGDTLHYAADATDSSGGTGTTQPPPDAMQVKYVAEGLDGLAAALESAMDGAAPRNIGPGGAPVSAPLIGTDLDAGAGVPDKLRDLTSSLRDELEKPAVTDAVDADALIPKLRTATETAIAGTDGFADPGAVTVAVTCGGTDGACDPCPEPDPDDEDPPACTTDSPTGWDTVTISTTLSSDGTTSGQAPFDTGLAGLAVHSDAKVATETSWSIPVTLQLQRGVGPQVVVGDDDSLALDVEASLPEDGIDAVVGYLPAHLTPTSDSAGAVHTVIDIAPDAGSYDLFDLYDGKLAATPTFSGDEADGLSLDFETLTSTPTAQYGGFDLLGNIAIPWSPGDGYGDITYNDVKLDVGDIIAGIATPFAVVDPYLAPVRDVVDVLRTPIPVISDLSELAGGDEVSLLSLLETLSAATQKPQLEMAHRVIGLVGGVTDMIDAVGKLHAEQVPLQDLAGLGAVLTVEPSEVALYEKCTQSVRTTTPAGTPGGTPTTKKTAPKPCPDTNIFANQKKKSGAAGQTTGANRAGKRNVKQQVSRKTTSVTASLPGFSLPFLSDPDQLMDLVTGEGEASYFRLDLGTLAASVAYTQRFGPIMAGPVPIMPFVGGSISVEGRLAMGFDSHAQTLAVQSLSDPGDTAELLDKYAAMDGGDIIREGFYLDDLDADGVDVPEVKIVTTLEAGAGVSIGIVTAGLKGGITLTINLDLNDPNDDGRLRTAEIRDTFENNAECIFDASATIEAFIAVFVEIQLLLTTLNYDFDILRLGPYTLFEYGCPTPTPKLVVRDGGDLALTSGDRVGLRNGYDSQVVDEYEVRQFDRGGGTTYEVSAFGRVQNVVVEPAGDKFSVTIYQAGIATSTTVESTFTLDDEPTFVANGATGNDKLSFLQGEAFDDTGTLLTTPFDTRVTALAGGDGDDVLVTGDGDDSGIDGGAGVDSIDTGDGHDVATGGSGNDVIGGGAGRDDLSGGPGDDRVEGGAGGDRANGGDGNDSLVGGPGRDVRAVLVLPENTPDSVVTEQVRAGFDSGDVLVGAGGADTVDGGDGSDVVVGGDAADLTGPALGSLFETRDRTVNVLEQGNTNPGPMDVAQDTAKVPGAAALDGLCESGSPLGGAGTTDFVTGGAEADVVVGGNGADTLDGGGGPDEVCGRAGDDQLIGDGAQTDDSGNADVIRGGHGDDRADGGPGDDVMFGDDVVLFRGTGDDAHRVLDGTLGNGADGTGRDYLDGGEGADIQSGGAGSDLLVGGVGDDASYGEGRDTAEAGGAAPDVSQRLLACSPTTRVVNGLVDLDGDLLAGAGGGGITADTGLLAGLHVTDGRIQAADGTPFTGLLGDTVVVDGRVDVDRNGTTATGDTGMIPLPSMLGTGDNTDGDCILAGEGDDALLGGTGSDYLGAGTGTDLASGGDGNDLVLGDDGVDVVLGGPHHDVLVGGLGDDHLVGGNGDDRLRGNEGADDLVGGSDTAGADDGQDVLLGGREDDVLAAENATAVSRSIVDAVTARVPDETTGDDPDDTVPAVPWSGASYVPAAVTARDGSNLVFDDSALLCGDQTTAHRWLTVLPNDGEAGQPEQSPGTELAYDELYGGYDCDFVFGSTGDDLVRGGQDDDVVEAGPGADIAYGDDDDDVVVGGSTFDHFATGPVRITTDRDGAGVADRGDTMLRGDGGPDGPAYDGDDLVVGDNALPVRVPGQATGPDYVVELHDVGSVTQPADAAASGADTLRGDGGVDRLLGQGGADRVDGGEGDDYVEGNDGGDTLTGGNGADDVVGGSSAADGRPLGATGDRLTAELAGPFDGSAAGLLDRGTDTIRTGAGADVVLGDNGRITRPGTASDRQVARADEAGTADVSDADRIGTGADADRVFGQGGDDLVDAGSENDHVEGNEGADGLTGGAGADVVIGGSSLSPDGRGTLDDAVDRARTQLDGNDVIYGDLASDVTAASDLLLGDNATVLFLDSGLPVVQLADVPRGGAAAAGTSGDDTIHGGEPAEPALAAPDRVFGQGGDDRIDTGSAGDYVEGGPAADDVTSGAGDDDVVGGSSASNGRPLGDAGTRLHQRVALRLDTSAAGVLDAADTVHGGAGDDTVLGDNGRITRPTDGERPVPDVAMADTGNQATYGSDELYGEQGDDVLYGQLDDGSDWGEGDRLEGGGDADTLLGDLAVVTRTPASDLSAPTTLALNSEAISEDVYPSGSIVPETWVPEGQARNGGPDLALGGDGDDVLHLGGGSDLANGGTGDDAVFGGDAADALWGGLDHDRIFGGYGDDDIDLKLRSGDPAAYAAARDAVDADDDVATTNGDDLVYGGWGADEMQSDVGGAGRQPVSDHLVDWVGAHNVYYVCGGAYGAGRIIRQSGPGMHDLLSGLAEAAGTRELTERDSGGWFDLGMVENRDKKDNNKRSPEHPGHFTCG